ncbi:MAG TPA: PASTA domain-containing protein [Candidatus Luteococcus avicola]|nr:PASTA domain-containing protein [Candidatus Luteococcus avicola]
MSWWTSDVINHWTAVMLLFLAVAWLLTVLAGMRLPEGQCGHPTTRSGLCKRPRLPGQPHCGIPAHRPDWQLRYTASALAWAVAGSLVVLFHPLPRHDLAPSPAAMVPPVTSYTPPTAPTPADSTPTTTPPHGAVAPVHTAWLAAVASPAAGGASGPADQGDYSGDDATAGGPVPPAGQTKVPTVLVRDMIGLHEDQAREQAAATDLPYDVTHRAVDDPSQDGKVIAQSPTGGTRGRAGDTIHLVIGTYTAPAEPSTAPEPTAPASPAPAAAEPSGEDPAATSSPS